MPLECNAFKMEGGKLNLGFSYNVLKLKILFSPVDPVDWVFSIESGKIQLKVLWKMWVSIGDCGSGVRVVN